MAPSVLVVDGNDAFATMLSGMLESEGDYVVDTVRLGSDALQRLSNADYDLTIVDMDLDPDDMDYESLVQAVREIEPTMRVILIPLMGRDLPADALALDIQGTLTKPFFVDDLLPILDDALSRSVKPAVAVPLSAAPKSVAAPVSAPPTTAMVRSSTSNDEIHSALVDLARETSADQVLLIDGKGDGGTIVAEVSALPEEVTRQMASQGLALLGVAQAMADLLGEPDRPFEHHMFEGESLRLYMMVFQEGLCLMVTGPVATPLGTVRHNLRRAARIVGQLTLT